jgi:hypothetical protein
MTLPLVKTSMTKSEAVKRRTRGVVALMQRMRTIAPWLQDSDLPVLRGFAELEYLARRVFTLLREEGLLNDKRDAKRLLSEYRSLRTAQAGIAAQLGLTPVARRELTSKQADGFDFAIEMTEVLDAERDAEVNPPAEASAKEPQTNGDDEPKA